MSFGFYGSSQTSLVNTLANPAKLPDDDERSLVIPDNLKNNLPKELLQKIQGILDCEKIPLDGRVTFLRRIVVDYTNSPSRFFGQMGVLDYIRNQTFNELFMTHIKKEYKFFDTNPNGSCGFEALTMPFQDVGWNVPKLRAAIGAFTRKNLEKLKTRDERQGGFADIFEVKTEGELDDKKIESYIQKIEHPQTISDGWLSVRDIVIFVHCMHRAGINVVVNVHSHFYYNDDLGTYVPEVYNTNLNGQPYAGDKEPIYVNLYWNGSGHYDYLDRIEKPAAAVDDDVIDMDDDVSDDKKKSSSSSSSMMDVQKKSAGSAEMVIDTNDMSDSD